MIACVVIAGGQREQLLDTSVIPSILAEEFDEVVVVGRHHAGTGFRYLFVPCLTRTTIDALVKRDVGTLSTQADVLVYLSDDHAVRSGFGDVLRQLVDRDWDVLVPSRWAEHPVHGMIRIPNGEEQAYCAGHAGVFRRWVVQSRPWTAQRHDRLWDLYSSHDWQREGVRFVSQPELGVVDLEPGREPWR